MQTVHRTAHYSSALTRLFLSLSILKFLLVRDGRVDGMESAKFRGRVEVEGRVEEERGSPFLSGACGD